MFNEKYNNSLEAFDIAHLGILFVFLVVLILVIKFDQTKFDKVFRYTLATISLTLEVSYHIWVLVSRAYSVDMIPFLGLCATVNLLTIISLYFDYKKIIELIYYWAITGAFFSLIFIDTQYTLPHFRYFHYFIVHYIFFLSCIYYFKSNKIKLTRKSLNKSCLILFIYSLIILMLDIIFKKNWFFMITSPVEEISNFLGYFYPIGWIITIFIMFNAIYYLSNILKKD